METGSQVKVSNQDLDIVHQFILMQTLRFLPKTMDEFTPFVNGIELFFKILRKIDKPAVNSLLVETESLFHIFF